MNLIDLSQSIDDFQNAYENAAIILGLGDEAESNILEVYAVLAQFCAEQGNKEITQEVFTQLREVAENAISEMNEPVIVDEYFIQYFEILAVDCGLSNPNNNNNQTHFAQVEGFKFEETLMTYADDDLGRLISMSGLDGMDLVSESPRPTKKQMIAPNSYVGSLAFEQTVFGSSKDMLPQILNLNSLLNHFIEKTESKKLSILNTVSQNIELSSILTSVDSLNKLLSAFDKPAQVEVMKIVGMETIQAIYEDREAEMDALLNQMSEIAKELRPSARMGN